METIVRGWTRNSACFASLSRLGPTISSQRLRSNRPFSSDKPISQCRAFSHSPGDASVGFALSADTCNDRQICYQHRVNNNSQIDFVPQIALEIRFESCLRLSSPQLSRLFKLGFRPPNDTVQMALEPVTRQRQGLMLACERIGFVLDLVAG